MTREAKLEGDVAQIANIVRDDFSAMKGLEFEDAILRKKKELEVSARLAYFCIPFDNN